MKDGLDVGTYQKPCTEWRERKKAIAKKAEKVRAERMTELNRDSARNPGTLDKEVMVYLVSKVLEQYP